MGFSKITIFFFVICLILKSTVEAAEINLADQISITTGKPEFDETESQIDKRDSNSQIELYNSYQQPISYSSNDEPFRPMIGQTYFGSQPPTKYFSEPTILPQAADVYYDSFTAASNRGSAKARPNAQTTAATPVLPPHSNAPLAGSFLSTTAGLRYHGGGGYRGPLNQIFYQNDKQPQQTQKANVKQETQITSAVLAPPSNKGAQYSISNSETKSKDQKSNTQQHPQQQQYQTQYILQPQQQQQPHAFNRYQAHNQHVYMPQQQATLRPTPQHHVQYIVAIPLSYLRKFQQPQFQQHHVGNYEQQLTPTPFIGPLARDHYGAYRPSLEIGTPAHSSPQQYVQLPTNVLHAAVQAIHNYQQHRPQSPQPFQQQLPVSTYEQTQYTYYPHQEQQQQEAGQPQQVSAYVTATPDVSKTQELQQASTVHIGAGGAKSNHNKNVEQKTATPIFKSIIQTPTVNTPAPIVHYNPLYVQAPPPEQEPLFSGINYHRFTTGGFQATTPVPFVRLSHVAPAHSHYYTSLSHPAHPQHVQPLFNPYRPAAHVPINGLPYFTQPGGVHYGTHLYHPSTSRLIASPPISEESPIPSKDSNVNTQQQTQNAYQQYASSGSHHAASESATNQGNHDAVNGNTRTEANALVKYP